MAIFASSSTSVNSRRVNLAALVRVENLGPAVLRQRLLDRFDAEGRLHCDRDAMGQDPSAEHIDDRREIDEATPHRNVGDVHCPRLVGPLDLQSAQQVRVDLVTRCRLARVRATIDRLDPHALHQRRDVAATGVYALPPQQRSQHTRSREGIIEMQLIEPTHQGKVLGRNWPRFIVDRAASQLQDLRLAHDRKIMTAVDHRFALSRPALVCAFR